MKLQVGDFAEVVKSKFVKTGETVKLLMEIQEGIFLCGVPGGNFIIVADNLKAIKG